ncbi:Neutral ceramidase [Hondaea fermentalgiana]|uniref:Neutral ceramidase n=1 Tax=Hondaea fermentalgiana TaxID=2315210 RepID=A0A2R5GDE5_9STRA|nr:Neutral ceramidase [Hondaea fermentalgiana]|eukprot:GBG28585.1 Neutral ceramidase [Hondaea fermentalgiana]
MAAMSTSVGTRLLVMVLSATLAVTQGYWVGVGQADVTGPAADVNMMGYAMPAQTTGGIHFRLRARAFVFGDDEAANDPNATRVAFVSLDACMGTQAVTDAVVSRLEKRFPGVYSAETISISGTHTHSAPAGFLQNVLFQVPSLGFVHEAFESFVSGIVEAIARAHESARAGRKMEVSRAAMAPGEANINRSPSGYANNPKEERELYGHNTDLNATVLRIEESDGTPVGMVNWFSVHGTSMPNTNHLISGDNKGYASQLFDAWYNGPEVLTGNGSFVSAFASTNLGDVSPNINGTFCSDSGEPCEELHSTCHGFNEQCHGRGPSDDPFESTRIVGTRQAEFARKLYDRVEGAALVRAAVDGPIKSAHVYRDMSNLEVELEGGKTVRTCKPALGYSFAAGTTDGPGAFDFVQSEKSTNPLWEMLRNILKKPSDELKACQHPKPVLLPTGEMTEPYPWHPVVMPISIFQIGYQLAIINVPSEFTTMAGRRMRAAVRAKLVEGGGFDAQNGVVVIAGLANEYSSYVTTLEEYEVQRYEAASTLYGPYTHAGYVQEAVKLAGALNSDTKPSSGPAPPSLMGHQISLLPPPLPDTVPMGSHFGDVKTDVEASYDLAPDTLVSATFWSANPRNNMRLGGTYLTVEYQNTSGVWEVIATDSEFETRFIYQKLSAISLHSVATVEWRPGQALRKIVPGKYRLRHFGDRKHLTGRISSFEGTSRVFELQAAPPRRYGGSWAEAF